MTDTSRPKQGNYRNVTAGLVLCLGTAMAGMGLTQSR